MQFDSFTFLIFFLIVLLAYNLLGGWSARKTLLLMASYVFYAGWNPPFVLLLIASTTLDWWIALRIHRAATPTTRKAWISATLLINLGLLGYFKYSDLLLHNLATLLAGVGVFYQPPALDIVLPIGISFYTFHSLAYCLDVYRGKLTPTHNWRDYALYVGFFPQLVAGPIVRWTQMGYQIEAPRKSTIEGLALGMSVLLLGLFEKVAMADGVFAPVADQFFSNAPQASTAAAWSGVLAFSGQIFCDFAGYSTCAIGAAMCLGFRLPINFRNPYVALGFSDFWRRWHISLSTWLRDYLYISLGGNRHGTWRTHRNIMLTMLIGGLWHGASWTFVAWGGLHGLYLVVERVLRSQVGELSAPIKKPACLLLGGITLLAVTYAWVWFRTPDFATGWLISGKLAALDQLVASATGTGFDQRLAVALFIGLIGVQLVFRNVDPIEWMRRLPAPALALLLAILSTFIVLSPGETHAFIYFQF